MMMLRRLLLAASLLPATELTAQTTVQVFPSADATLYEDPLGALANGAGTGIHVGTTGQGSARRGLLRYDVAGVLPAGARVLSARFRLSVEVSASPLPLPTTVHRVLSDWTEGPTVASGGQGAGSPSQAGDVTWIHTTYPNALWNNPGSDHEATPSFSFDMPVQGVFLSESLPGLVSDLQFWLDNPGSNFGWLLRSDELTSATARRFGSRQTGNPGDQPSLLIAYLPAGEAGIWGTGCGAAPMQMATTGPATAGTVVQLDYSVAPASSVGATFWSLQLDPVGVLLGPCTVYLSPFAPIVAGNAFATSAGGTANDSFTIPLNAPGFLLVCQGAVLDGSPLGFSLSNAGVLLTQ